MLALQKKIKKTFKNFIWEYRYERDQLILKRLTAHKGSLIVKNNSFLSQTHVLTIKSQLWLDSAIKKIKSILIKYNNFRFIFTKNAHQIKLLKTKNKTIDWFYWTFYLEIKIDNLIFSQAFNIRDGMTPDFLDTVKS
jgi:hypothetical protein